MPDALSDPLPEEMAAAYARYLRTTMIADPRIQSARTVAEMRSALVACLVDAALPINVTVERDPHDTRRMNIAIVPKPGVTVTAVVRR